MISEADVRNVRTWLMLVYLNKEAAIYHEMRPCVVYDLDLRK